MTTPDTRSLGQVIGDGLAYAVLLFLLAGVMIGAVGGLVICRLL